MPKQQFAGRIKPCVDEEITLAADAQSRLDPAAEFRHLERAHVMGQAVTAEHARVHWLMLKFGWRQGDWREVAGQVVRLVGAATKTPFGIRHLPGGEHGRGGRQPVQGAAGPRGHAGED